MAAFRIDKTYTLHRKASRDIEVDCVTHWSAWTKKGKEVRHVIFSMGLRQAAKHGNLTAPKVWLDQVYSVERPDRKTVWVKIYRQRPGPDLQRLFWARQVKKPSDWSE